MSPFWILSTATALIVVLTVLPWSRHPAWWIRCLDFPRVQLAFLAALLLGAQVVWLDWGQVKSWALMTATGAAFVYHLAWIWPYTRLSPKEVKVAVPSAAPHRLSVLSSNVLMTNRRAGDLLRLVERWEPDLLVTLETNRWWEQQLEALHERYPHRLCCPLENLYGMHLYSKHPLVDPKIQFLVEEDKPSMHTLVRLPDGRHVQLHCLHPAPPSPTENESSSERDAELVMVGRAVANMPMPVLVTGDLNDVAWSTTTRLFRKLSGLLDPRIGRGTYSTFHTRYPFLRWPLDHFFHSRHFTLVRLERLVSIGSDHYPMYIELALGDPTAAEQADEGLEPDEEDHEVADEKTAEEGVTPRQVHCPRERREPRERSGYQDRSS